MSHLQNLEGPASLSSVRSMLNDIADQAKGDPDFALKLQADPGAVLQERLAATVGYEA